MFKKSLVIACISLITFFYSYTGNAETKFVDRPDVQAFIKKMVIKHGFHEGQLIALFDKVKIRPRVMQSIKAPLEQETWQTYRKVFITKSHIDGGVNFWKHHEKILARAEKKYGVPASIIVATIGVETKYGKNKGEYPVIDALTNIAFSGSPRQAYFRSELEEFLLLAREQHLNPLTIKGSYAGAIGQPQFMPSSYRYYAVNFSGKKKIDLSNNIDDIVGSIANYYQKHGWKTNGPVAVPTTLTHTKHSLSLNEKISQKKLYKHDLAHLGLHTSYYIPSNLVVNAVELKNKNSYEYWIAFPNFQVIKRYNPSDLYAMAVYQLSYHIKSSRRKIHHV
ncbi:MAG: lytic murein transglycosylase B [Gammaproteobacteria bacterium]|nr:lytic murein transglycosylase B [Gammaproteobacteria bacterium]